MTKNKCPHCGEVIHSYVTVKKGKDEKSLNSYQIALKSMGNQRKLILKYYFVDGLRIVDIARKLKLAPQQIQNIVSEIKKAALEPESE